MDNEMAPDTQASHVDDLPKQEPLPHAAFVGPHDEYDFMGATQFRLLCALGLRAHHRLLDFGCGSLRAGRFLITYLGPGNYFGIEPNKWLVDAAFEKEIGADIRRIKNPSFSFNDDFMVTFGGSFDFILAQSIFSHTELDLLERALGNLAGSLAPDGLIVCTFLEASRDCVGDRWIYPDCVTFRPATIQAFLRRAGLHGVRVPWYHPRQDWYILARDRSRLPGAGDRMFLHGAVLNVPRFRESHSVSRRATKRAAKWVARRLPARFKDSLKRILRKENRSD
jgi:SAM-dependent methyltransferase